MVGWLSVPRKFNDCYLPLSRPFACLLIRLCVCMSAGLLAGRWVKEKKRIEKKRKEENWRGEKDERINEFDLLGAAHLKDQENRNENENSLLTSFSSSLFLSLLFCKSYLKSIDNTHLIAFYQWNHNTHSIILMIDL